MTTIETPGTNTLMNIAYIPVIVCCSYLGISWESMALLAVLLWLDYLTGIAKVYVLDKNSFRSHRAIAGIIAKVTLLLVPIVFAVLAKQIGYDIKVFTDGIISMLMLAEAFSVIGNIRSIHAGEEVPEIDIMSVVLGKISAAIEALLNKD